MANNKVEQKKDTPAQHKSEQRKEQAAKQDDLLWTQRLAVSPGQALSGRGMPTLKSRIAGLLDERFDKLFKSVEASKLAKKEGSIQQRLKGEPANRADPKPQATPRTQQAITGVKGAFNEALAQADRFSPRAPDAESRDNTTRRATPQQVARQKAVQQQITRAADASRQSWIVFASQLIGANLKRLGVEPSELDDIRLFLIREGAASYAELKKLTRLPDSLDPAAELKALEDIKVLMMAYVVQATQEQILAELETEEEAKDPLGLPTTVANRFADIPEVEVDPSKLLELGLVF